MSEAVNRNDQSSDIVIVGGMSKTAEAALFDLCEAAVGRKDLRSKVKALALRIGDAAGNGELAERLLALIEAPTSLSAGRGWVSQMFAKGKLNEAGVRAAIDLCRAVVLWGNASGAGLRAVDPSRVVVDGGPVARHDTPAGGIVMSAEVGRLEAWRRVVADLPVDRRVVRGRERSMARDVMTMRVVVDGIAPRTLDTSLGLRNGRAQEVALVELERYARLNLGT